MSYVPIRVLLQADGPEQQARDLLGRFANFEPVMRGPVRRLIRKAIVAQFRTRGRFGGTPWDRLAKSTRDYKRKHGEWRQEPMRRTDKLYESLVHNTENTVESFTKNGYILRTLVSYAKYHQSPEPRTSNLPRRAIIPDTMPDEFMVQLRNLLKNYLVAGEIAE